MAFVAQLWLPILLSGLFVFIASAISWMVMPHHQKEFAKLPSEAGVLAALRAHPASPGLYAVPGVNDPSERQGDAWKAELTRGPGAYITLIPGGMPSMGPTMLKSLLGNIAVSFFCAYVASHALPSTANYLEVFRIVGALGFMSYSLATLQESVWFGRPWSAFAKQCVDALVFAGLMGGTFGWLWK